MIANLGMTSESRNPSGLTTLRLLGCVLMSASLLFIPKSGLTETHSKDSYHKHGDDVLQISETPATRVLRDLAEAKFGRLGTAEALLLTAYASGEAVDCVMTIHTTSRCRTSRTGPDPKSFLDRYRQQSALTPQIPGNDRMVRASLIRWLLTDVDVIRRYDPLGIFIIGAYIVEPLDLRAFKISFPVALLNCAIRDPITLESAELPQLYLDGSRIGMPGATLLGIITDLTPLAV